MRKNRNPGIWALLLLTGCLAFGLAACGSSDSGKEDNGSDKTEATSNGDSQSTGKQADGKPGENGTAGKAGGKEITPEKKAPESAGDKGGKAPDAGISDRPGGPGTPKPEKP